MTTVHGSQSSSQSAMGTWKDRGDVRRCLACRLASGRRADHTGQQGGPFELNCLGSGHRWLHGRSILFGGRSETRPDSGYGSFFL